MILEIEHWHLGYVQILSDCRHHSVLMVCHVDVDSMAAAHILSTMLRQDQIRYQLVPCTSYQQLQQILRDNRSQDDCLHRAVVLLNLGATRNLTRLFQEDASEPPLLQAASENKNGTKVFCLDHRRPIHLANIYANDDVVIFFDRSRGEGDVSSLLEQDGIPSDGDNLSGHSSSEEEEDDDEDSDEEDPSVQSSDHEEHEFEMEDDIGRQRQVPRQDDDASYDADREDDEDPEKTKLAPAPTDETALQDSDDDQSVSAPSPTQQQSPVAPTQNTAMTAREIHEDRSRRIQSYYAQGTYGGSPAAYIAHRMATQLRFGPASATSSSLAGDLLWWACVGVTDAYLHHRLDVTGYTALAMDLRLSCQKLFPTDLYSRIAGANVYADHLLTGPAADLAKVRWSENGRILCETDFRFFLLRHSSLYEAMTNSEYISNKFQLLGGGIHRLLEMLAKMGFPLSECKQPFAMMKPALRRQLQDKFRFYGPEYGLMDAQDQNSGANNFEFTSFFRITGYQSLLSASDTSYAASALLECEYGGAANANEENEKLIQLFNTAFDAINPASGGGDSSGNSGNSLKGLVNGGSASSVGGSPGGLGTGIRLAMSLQRSIINTAAYLVSRNIITRLSHFRYAYVTVTSRGENAAISGIDNDILATNSDSDASAPAQFHIFSKPLALTRLAHFLMDLHRENGKWTGNKARPLVLLAEKPVTSTFLVVGYEFPEQNSDDFIKNRFGKNFELAAQSMNLKFRSESFDSHVVEVDSTHVQRFLEQLHYLLDESSA
jgi:cell division control protein 45